MAVNHRIEEHRMSLLTLGSVGIGRDLVAADDVVTTESIAHRSRRDLVGRTARGVAADEASSAPTKHETQSADVATFGQLLVAQIPSEALLAYTTILALFAAAGPDQSYKSGRWVVYVGAIIVSAAGVLASYTSQRHYGFADKHTQGSADAAKKQSSLGRLHLPILPMAAAVVSMAIYGLTVPGSPLQFAVSGTAFTIWAGSLAVSGGVVMSIFATVLGKGNGANAVPTGAPHRKTESAEPNSLSGERD
jgi:hypothetical protein